MAKENIVFRLVMYTDAAGKRNPELFNEGNEDNLVAIADVSGVNQSFTPDAPMALSDYGCLMVVADGMGGMNAGEVASAIAVKTVREFFEPGKISAKMLNSATERQKYLEHIIKEADRRIKTDALQNPEHEGMGSTIIMAWIVGRKLTLSWCGDSRAYRYNPVNGIEPLSRDHSYVQELVNQGILEYKDTFEHPQGNIVTRSLGDPNSSAQPESRQFELYKDDIVLLCSDGLSGVLRDCKTYDHNGVLYPGENLEDIIAANTDSMDKCRRELWAAAERADWYDNVTALLFQVLDGAPVAPKREEPTPEKVMTEKGGSLHSTLGTLSIATIIRKKWWLTAIAACVLAAGAILLIKGVGNKGKDEPKTAKEETVAGATEEVVAGETREAPVAPFEAEENMTDAPGKPKPERTSGKRDGAITTSSISETIVNSAGGSLTAIAENFEASEESSDVTKPIVKKDDGTEERRGQGIQGTTDASLNPAGEPAAVVTKPNTPLPDKNQLRNSLNNIIHRAKLSKHIRKLKKEIEKASGNAELKRLKGEVDKLFKRDEYLSQLDNIKELLSENKKTAYNKLYDDIANNTDFNYEYWEGAIEKLQKSLNM